MTKKQKSAKAKRTAKKTRVKKAVQHLLKTMNPASAKHLGGAQIRRNPGGSITIVPVKLPHHA